MKITLKNSQIQKLKLITFGILIVIAVRILIPNMQPQAKLANNLEMGVTELNVEDLALQRQFYADIVGLDVITEDSNEILLGRGNTGVIKLVKSTLPDPQPNDSGLYHNAIVFESRQHLANTVLRVINKSGSSFEGTADHLVSEAFYFHDFEGNGVELYFDKDRSEWKYINGQVQMGSEYIDPEEYISKYADPAVAKSAAKMGHVHLKVGDIPQAKGFYTNVLGFDITAEMPTALFVSVGGYHHHLGMNTWHSLGSSRRGETMGLRSFEIQIPTSDIDQLKSRLNSKSVAFDLNGNGIKVTDPWGNVMVVSTKSE